MKKTALFLLLVPACALAAEKKPLDPYCAKTSLAAIYGGEAAYHAEYNAYSNSLDQIGFTSQGDQCNEWKLELRIGGDGQSFIGTAKHGSGEEWSINEKKVLVREYEAL